MSPELQRIQRADRLMMIIWQNGGTHTESDKLCTACQQVKSKGLADKDGHFICYDCYNIFHPEHAQAPVRHPQGDFLANLPASPRFVKKFP